MKKSRSHNNKITIRRRRGTRGRIAEELWETRGIEKGDEAFNLSLMNFRVRNVSSEINVGCSRLKEITIRRRRA